MIHRYLLFMSIVIFTFIFIFIFNTHILSLFLCWHFGYFKELVAREIALPLLEKLKKEMEKEQKEEEEKQKQEKDS